MNNGFFVYLNHIIYLRKILNNYSMGGSFTKMEKKAKRLIVLYQLELR
jgi:hypothetical protein